MARTPPSIGRADAVAVVEAIAAEPAAQALAPDERQRLERLVVSLDRRLRNDATSAKLRLVVHDELRWFEVEGAGRVSLQRRGPVRLLFKALVDQHRQGPGRATSLRRRGAATRPGAAVAERGGRRRLSPGRSRQARYAGRGR